MVSLVSSVLVKRNKENETRIDIGDCVAIHLNPHHAILVENAMQELSEDEEDGHEEDGYDEDDGEVHDV